VATEKIKKREYLDYREMIDIHAIGDISCVSKEWQQECGKQNNGYVGRIDSKQTFITKGEKA